MKGVLELDAASAGTFTVGLAFDEDHRCLPAPEETRPFPTSLTGFALRVKLFQQPSVLRPATHREEANSDRRVRLPESGDICELVKVVNVVNAAK
eukprot:2221860-Amphidinium_carterae.1